LPEQKISDKKNHLLSWLVFLPTFVIVSFTLVFGMFPALLIAFSNKVRFPVEINIWEPGVWMFPILISNTIIFATIILYQKNKLPHRLTSLFKFILNIEISTRITLVLIGILIGSYVIFTIGDLYIEEPWEDYGRSVKEGLQNTSFDTLNFNSKALPYFFGFYDRFLAEHKIITISLTLEKQIVKNIPKSEHDVIIDWIVTEDRVLKTQR